MVEAGADELRFGKAPAAGKAGSTSGTQKAGKT